MNTILTNNSWFEVLAWTPATSNQLLLLGITQILNIQIWAMPFSHNLYSKIPKGSFGFAGAHGAVLQIYFYYTNYELVVLLYLVHSTATSKYTSAIIRRTMGET